MTMFRSPIFRNGPPQTPRGPQIPLDQLPLDEFDDSNEDELDDLPLAELRWGEVKGLGLKIPNPPPQIRPVTLALDLIEVNHQLGSDRGKSRVTLEDWSSVFYRGDDMGSSDEAKARGFERWKNAVRTFGLACGPADHRTFEDPKGHAFCVDMSRAIPWAERVLETSERKATEKKAKKPMVVLVSPLGRAKSKVAANSGGNRRRA